MLSTYVLAQGIYWSQFVLNVKMLVGTFNQEKAFYVFVNLREPSFEALVGAVAGKLTANIPTTR